MGEVNVQFNGPVGQTIVGGEFGAIHTTVKFDDDGGMVVETVMTAPARTPDEE